MTGSNKSTIQLEVSSQCFRIISESELACKCVFLAEWFYQQPYGNGDARKTGVLTISPKGQKLHLRDDHAQVAL